ncbi:recombinase family protein [Lachnospiraceae bacterium]|nr:recombinase family protein [Lachnospiraceae bacterium]
MKQQIFYGYCRVSSIGQNEDRQIIAMEEKKIPAENIYVDRQSGKDFNRPQYKRLVRKLNENTVLYISSIDRLGRNYKEIQEQWHYISKVKKSDIVVMDMPLLDTRRGKDLMGTFLSDIVLQVLSFVAENERHNIRQRQAQGIAAAKARGVKFGRPVIPLPENFDDVYYLWKKKEISGTKAAELCGLSRSTFYNKVMRFETDNHKYSEK